VTQSGHIYCGFPFSISINLSNIGIMDAENAAASSWLRGLGDGLVLCLFLTMLLQ